MNKFSYKIFCLKLATWKHNPSSLVARVQAAHEPIYYKSKKVHLRDGAMYWIRIWLKPLMMYCLRVAYKDTGFKPIGYGYFSAVLLKNNKVYKCLEFTTSCSDEERQKLARVLGQRIELSKQYFGPHHINTTVSIEGHLITGIDCVVLRQEYVKGRILNKLPYSKYLSDTSKKDYLDLLLRAKKLLEGKGFLLDTYVNNLIEVKDKILIIDTVPLSPIDIKLRPALLRIFNKELKTVQS